ncbi:MULTISPECIES: cytochrome c biogenesis protein ResB [Candidatus Ichthyocystis]|uniref:cytochrome c biogenesis protein ResB n=2 Tax=Burkholderiales genera incertae sedis TaxID=224471 RepID=UPI000B85E583|nr:MULTISPECIES: cytochrome c biogenesis protein ResB [Ichthyocystis]
MRIGNSQTLRWYSCVTSMGFAVSLLIILSAASIIGTVLTQGQSNTAYLNQFGLFWFPFFKYLGLYNVYNSVWYITILVILVLSVSCCIHRQIPEAIKKWHNFNFPENLLNKAESKGTYTVSQDELKNCISTYLRSNGYRVAEVEDKKQQKVSIVGKIKSWRFVGYFLTHSAIIVICLGALIDGHIPLLVKIHLKNKKPLVAGSDYSSQNIINTDSVSYRANLFLRPGLQNDNGIINFNEGTLIQKLPFFIELRNFKVDWYQNGTPRQFVSTILLTDKGNHKSFEHKISVNHPLRYRNFTIYQSSFSNSGTTLTLNLLNISDLNSKGSTTKTIKLKLGQKEKLQSGYTIELLDFKERNIEDKKFLETTTKNKRSTLGSLMNFFSSAGVLYSRQLIDLGPDFTYRITYNDNSIVEYHNFSHPVMISGLPWIFLGVRNNRNENFSYWKIPTDSSGNLTPFLSFRNLLINPHYRKRTVSSFLDKSPGSHEDKLQVSILLNKMLLSFSREGFRGIFRLLHIDMSQNKLSADQERLIRIFERLCLFVWQNSMKQVDSTRFWDYLVSVSDGSEYHSSFIAKLSKYKIVNNSILEITKSPGLSFIGFGSIFIVMGIIIMLYIHEKKVFILIRQHEKNINEVLVGIKDNQTLSSLDEFTKNLIKEIEIWAE